MISARGLLDFIPKYFVSFENVFFHHFSLKILAVSMDMPVFFASIDEKIQIPMYTTHSGIKSIIQKMIA